MSKFENILSKKKAELIEEISNNTTQNDRENNYQYYILFGIEGNFCQDKKPIIKNNNKPSLFDDNTATSGFKPIKIKRDKYFSFLSSNLENIKGIFEERFFLFSNNTINFLGSKYYRYNKLKLCLLHLNTEVKFSVVISRTGEIATFLLNTYSKKDFSLRKEYNIKPKPNNLQILMDRFFENIFNSMNTSNCQEHFYNVFELYLKNSFRFLDGDFIHFNNQIMYKINLLGIVKFFILVDNYENFLGIFSAKNEKSLKNEILRILRFKDNKLKMKLI
jgi:hypothetical protein